MYKEMDDEGDFFIFDKFQIKLHDSSGDNFYRIRYMRDEYGKMRLFIQHNNGEGATFNPDFIYNLLDAHLNLSQDVK